MLINSRLDKENMVHIYHGTLCNHTKQDHVFCCNMDEAGGHYPKQTNATAENQIPHVLTYKKLNHKKTCTQREGQQTLGPT